MTEKNQGGRPVGTTQDVMNANKALKNVTDFHKMINADFLKAYEVLSEILYDDEAKPTLRVKVAEKVIDTGIKMAAQAGELIGNPTNRHQEKKKEASEIAKSVDNLSKVVKFAS